MGKISEKYLGSSDTISMLDIVNELNKKGYTIETVVASGNAITGITIDNNSLSISANGTATIRVAYEGSSDENTYYVVINGKYYQMSEKSGGGISINRNPSEVNNTGSGQTLTANVTSGNNVTIEGISGNVITLKGGSTAGSSVITISYGEYTKNCNVAVLVTPTESTVASETPPSFSTDYGLIDVIWLEGSSNNPTTSPNEPNLYTSLGETKKMTPVTWSKKADAEGNEIWEEDQTAKSTWYSYTANSGSDGKTDNTTSMWANAKNTDGSYFVWIPRYAYRITYYSDSSYENVTGCYDGWGMWNAVDGTLNYGIDEGIETVEYNGKKYVVHPSFMGVGKEDIGGGFGTDSNGITGFWVAKYEMSREGATASSSGSGYNTKFLSVPNVSSARYINIGNVFEVSKKYESEKESHMMKNSEWGAVAYLTQSQYGRNGHEIDINNNSNCITGNGGGAVGGSVDDASEITNAYNTATGAKASTTGNVYGIYDMSGGALEYVACFDKLSSGDYVEDSSYGLNLTKNAKDENGNYISTKYITAYSNGEIDYNSKIYSVGLMGDATKEVRRRTNSGSWFQDCCNVVSLRRPFLCRGGDYYGRSEAGVFCSSVDFGNTYDHCSWRLVLA